MKIAAMFGLLSISFLAACSVVNPHVSSMNYDPSTMEIVGNVGGESSQTWLLGVLPTSDGASTAQAIWQALKNAKADALINTVVDEERGIGPLFLFTYERITVSGLAIRFKNPATASNAPAIPQVQPPGMPGFKSQ